MMTKFQFLILVLAFLPLIAFAQDWKTLGTNDSLPLDDKVIYGKLDNGFTYYVCKDEKFKDERIKMNLVVKAGDFDLGLHEYQITHAIEHTPFLGTKHYPNGVESELKMEGRDVSASTGDVSTIYRFYLPVDRLNLLDSGLLFFQDIAENLTFNNESVRQVVGEVQRERLYSQGNVWHDLPMRFLPKLYKLFKIPESSKFKYMEDYTPSMFQKVYTELYQPQNMAVIITGGMALKSEEITALLKARFSSLKNASNIRRRKDYSSEYFHGKPQLVTISDREVTENRVLLYFRQRHIPTLKTKADYKIDLQRKLIETILDSRLRKEKYNPPYQVLSSGFFKKKYLPSYSIETKVRAVDSIQTMIKSIIGTIKGIKESGIYQSEINLAKKKIKNSFLRAFTGSELLIQACKAHFTDGEWFSENKEEMLRELLEGITLDDIQTFFNHSFNDKTPIDIVHLLPENGERFGKNKVFEWINNSWEVPVVKKRVEEDVIITPMTMDTSVFYDLKEHACVVKEFKEFDATEIVLHNGLRVIMKTIENPGADKSKIRFKGFRNGGASLYPDNFFSALNAADIIHNSGINGNNRFKLQRYLSEKKILLRPYISYDEIGFEGACPEEKLEHLMQLIYLYFSKPNYDKNAFHDWCFNAREHLAKKLTAPHSLLQDTLGTILNDNTFISASSRLRGLEQTDYQKAFDIYKERFSNAGDFTFVLTGDFQIKEAIPILNKYLGSLPDSGKYKILNVPQKHHFTHKPKSVHLNVDNMEGTIVNLCFADHGPYDHNDKVYLKVLQFVLTDVPMRRLRYEESGVYRATALYRQYELPSWFRMDIGFECRTKDVERMKAATWDEIRKLQQEGPLDTDFSLAVSTVRNILERGLSPRNSRAILKQIINYFQDKETPEDLREQKAYLDHITPLKIQDITRKYFSDKKVFQVVLSQKE